MVEPQSNPSPSSTGSAPTSPIAATVPLRETSGTRVGPYILRERLGEGGFGAVFRAQQESPVVREVAFKIIKLGMDTEQVVARFEQERQALALMDHPHIARVLDAGMTESGRPYFVMDLVRGVPIGEFCDRERLTVADRLGLFEQVCSAVQHAHSKGVIHRDLKPSNILISLQDGRPAAKVIDFGIAKATGSQAADRRVYTEQRQFIGTPEYMSPEQAEGSPDIDTRSDVYSLGVLLYELLTGSTPFTREQLRSVDQSELHRVIREQDPPKPSTRLAQATVSLSEVAARRRTEPRRLGESVRGELDWIVMKAMEKERARRYESPSALAADLRRHLVGEPVSAAPPSTVYRVQKFVRRHRVPVVAGALVAAALVLGVVGTAVGLVQARREGKIAESRLAEAEATVGFLDRMLAASDPSAQGKDVTVRRVLDEASKSIGRDFRDRPLVAARLHGTTGRTYLALGAYTEAESHFREQLALRTKELGADHEDTARAVNELGIFLARAGKHSEAEGVLKEALAANERRWGRRHPVTVSSLDWLSMLYVMQTRAADAEPLLKEVIEIRRAGGGEPDKETIPAMVALATIYADTDRFVESEKLFEESLAAQIKLTSPEHPDTLEIRSNVAWMQYWYAMNGEADGSPGRQRRLEFSAKLGEATLADRIRVLGEEHPNTLATLNNLSLAYRGLGRMDEAQALRSKDLQISLRVLGEEHPDVVVSLANMGAFLRGLDKCAEAVPYLERAVRVGRKVLPPGAQGQGFALGWLGSCLTKLGRYAEAETALLEAVDIIETVMGPDHPVAKAMAKDLVNLYTAWDKAEPEKGHGAKAQPWQVKMGTAPK